MALYDLVRDHLRRYRPPPVGSKPSRIKSFSTGADPSATFKRLISHAPRYGYTANSANEAEGYLELEELDLATRLNFKCPVYLSYQPDGKTLVEVGFESQTIKQESTIDMLHISCANRIRKLLFWENCGA